MSISQQLHKKAEILEGICYTDLVYGRINKKLKTKFSREEIEQFLLLVINNTEIKDFTKVGKNYYVSNSDYKIRITINSNTFRVITANKI